LTKTKAKHYPIMVSTRTIQRKRCRLIADIKQQLLSTTGTCRAPSPASRAAATEGFLVKRPKLDGKYETDDQKAPYTRLANLSCIRMGDLARQSYRMTTAHLLRLVDMLAPVMSPRRSTAVALTVMDERTQQNKALRIKAALRFFAGGDPREIASAHSIDDLCTLEAYIWDVVDAIHAADNLAIAFPLAHNDQREIAAGFELIKSDTGIENCCGALGGMLLATEAPYGFVENKGMQGFNVQAVCDHTGLFLDVSVGSAGYASDYKAFNKSSIRQKLAVEGFLAHGLTLYAHGDYPDDAIITRPPPSSTLDDDEACDKPHFQLRDQIDASFSALLQRWALLRRPLPAHLGHDKAESLILAICKLHNYCLQDTELMPPLLADDVVFGILNGAVLLDEYFRPAALLAARRNRDDVAAAELGCDRR
jgi:hypothetical protein